jgi:hypothetical protein
MSPTRPLAVTQERIRYGLGQTSIAAILVARSEEGVVAGLIQEHPGDKKLVAALQSRFRARSFGTITPGCEEWSSRWSTLSRTRAETLRSRRIYAAPISSAESGRACRKFRSGGRRPSSRSRARSAPQKQCVQSATPALRTRSSSPFGAIACCGAMTLTRVGPSGGSEWRDRRQETIVQREAASTSDTPSKRLSRKP